MNESVHESSGVFFLYTSMRAYLKTVFVQYIFDIGQPLVVTGQQPLWKLTAQQRSETTEIKQTLQ